MGRLIRLGQVRDVDISDAYLHYYPCLQATTDTAVVDRSGKGHDATLGGLSASEAWTTTANALSSLNTSGKAANIAAEVWQAWDYTKSFLIAMRCNLTKEAGTAGFYGAGTGTSGRGGIALRCAASGAVSFWSYKTDTTSSSTGDTTETPFASAGWHHIAAAYDAASRKVKLYIDGVVATNFSGGVSVASHIVSVSNLLDPFMIGGRASADVIAGAFQAVHAVLGDAALPGTIDDLVFRLYRHPFVPVSKAEWGS